jgi:hypothetical protein
MKVFIGLYVLVIGAYCAPMFDEQLDNQWSFFKRLDEKQYASIEEEITQ